jgi:hypothetical protein
MGWFIVLFVLVAVLIAGFNYYSMRVRQKMWLEVAARYNFRYSADDRSNLADSYDFALFKQGHSRSVYNRLDGAYDNLPVIVFDYRYKTGSGKSEETHYISAVLATLPIAGPYLMIRPEQALDRLAAFVGFADITFESDAFNRAFHVKGDDKKFAYDICHPRMMEFLLQNTSLTWELRGMHVLLYSWRFGTFNVEEVELCLHAAKDFVALLPDYLLQEGRT